MNSNKKMAALVLSGLLVLVATGHAQTTTQFGLKAGLSNYTFSGDAPWSTDADRMTFVVLGAFAEI